MKDPGFLCRRVFSALVMVLLLGQGLKAQVTTTGKLTGVVTDSLGAVLTTAQIAVKNDQTQANYIATSNKEGSWTLASIPPGVYTVTITSSGFKTTVIQGVSVEVGQPATVNAVLEIGGVGEQVVITGGGEVLQTASANISSSITGRQISELPFSTRDAMQLVLVLPGVQTPGTSRTSSVNGLPKSSLNITIDGANVQDNFLKSSDGFFTSTQPKSDAVEEVTVSTATPGAESAGGGAVQIRFVTRRGSPEFHGGVFWQHRNDYFNSNYYFNSVNGLPRDRILLNQFGGNIGGPIRIPKLLKSREKAFFFVNIEEFRLPQTFGVTRNVLTDAARAGNFTYLNSTTNAPETRNLFQLARVGAGGATYPSTIDPMTARALDLVKGATAKGILQSRVGTNNDFNRENFNFIDPAKNVRRFPTVRLDFNLTDNHHVEFIHNYQHYYSSPDGVNSIFSIYPGEGSVLGGDKSTGSIYRNSFTFAAAERWTLRSNLVNEVRFTSSGNGTSNFRREFGPGQFPLFNGYNVSYGTTPYISNYTTYTSNSRRNTPVKTLTDNLSWQKGKHDVNFGMSYTRISAWNSDIGNALVPTLTVGIATGDPVNTGATSLFTTANFPGSTAAQRTEAATLYAILTGRISSTTRSSAFNEDSRKFEFADIVQRNRAQEFGLYGQDSWKFSQSLTFTGGIRWEFAPSPINTNQVYTRTGPEGVYGVSGLGNLFNPGVYKGEVTQYSLLEKGEKAFPNSYNNFAPSFGFAWRPEVKSGVLKKILGESGGTVLRGGYSIAYVREGFNAFTSMFGSNEGVSYTNGTSPASNPSEFGTPGSRSLRDGAYPFLPMPSPVFPFTARQGAALNDFDPNIRPGYTQSWTLGIQRELSKDMALEVRYVGTHGTRLWRQYELGEVNIFENGFINEFKAAQANQAICQANAAACMAAQAAGGVAAASRTANSYGNWGLSGQGAIPIIQTGIGSTIDATTIVSIQRGEAGGVAASIAQNLTRMNNLIANPFTAAMVKPVTMPDPNNPGQSITLSNFFVANPRSPTSSWIMANGGDSNYHALQAELRRRLSRGLLVQGSYVWSKALTNVYAVSSAAASTPTTLRSLARDKTVAPRDSRHGFKVDSIYELPVGPGRAFLNGGPGILKKALEGWQLGGVARIQSGTPSSILSDRRTYNNREPGVVLHNITRNQLQDMVKIRKTTVCDPTCHGVVYYLPQDLIDNTLAAFEQGGKTLANLDPTKPYIGPPTTPGELGMILNLYGPWTSRFDLNLMKRTRIKERFNFEFRVQFLNAFNQSNIMIRGAGTDSSTFSIGGTSGASFGQTANAFRDFTVSGTNDPGGRLIEFQLRLNF
jgi:hypothetical protein